jgi:hypothetical protein
MSQIFASALQNLWTTLLLGTAVLAGIVYLFARSEALMFVRGLVRVLWSVISSPIAYMRRAIHSLAVHESEGARAESDQFLLNRLMHILQAIVILVGVSILAAGVIGTWKTLVPPKNVRDSYREAKASLEKERQDFAEVTTQVQGLDTQWEQSQAKEIEKARAVHVQSSRTAAAGMQSAELMAQQWAGAAIGVLSTMKTRAAELAGPGGDYAIERGASTLRSIINGNWYALTDEDRSLLSAWLERWEQKARADLSASRVTADSVRAVIQPSYQDLLARKQRLEQAVKEKESTVATLREASSLRFGAAFTVLLKTTFTFIVAVWFYGLLLESLWMLIRMAGDVRRMRLSAEAADAPAPVTSSPRLPISNDPLVPAPLASSRPAL